MLKYYFILFNIVIVKFIIYNFNDLKRILISSYYLILIFNILSYYII